MFFFRFRSETRYLKTLFALKYCFPFNAITKRLFTEDTGRHSALIFAAETHKTLIFSFGIRKTQLKLFLFRIHCSRSLYQRTVLRFCRPKRPIRRGSLKDSVGWSGITLPYVDRSFGPAVPSFLDSAATLPILPSDTTPTTNELRSQSDEPFVWQL